MAYFDDTDIVATSEGVCKETFLNVEKHWRSWNLKYIKVEVARKPVNIKYLTKFE
jgi:hypothetical protein